MITLKDIQEQREQAQEDILSVLDGLDQEYLDRVCQVIVDRFEILSKKMENNL